jgi:hypothetical protein
MKKVFLPFLITCLIFSSVIAQNRMRMGKDSKPLQRIEQWEKIKLIEVLGLNEDTAVRFFARRNENQKKMKDILDQRDGMIQNLEDDIRGSSQISEAAYKEQVNNFLFIESSISKERENFLRSLSDLLTPKQIAILIVFESRFRKEIRETLMNRFKPQDRN